MLHLQRKGRKILVNLFLHSIQAQTTSNAGAHYPWRSTHTLISETW